MQFENAAQVEESSAKMTADRNYQNLLAQAHAYFVPNTGHYQMWRQVQM